MTDVFVFGSRVPAVSPEPGVTRKVLATGESMMMVEVRFETGACGAPHSHPHEQVTYICEGRYRFTIGGETREVGPGDSVRFAPGVRHGTECLAAGHIVDVFSPIREDFL